MKRRLPDLPDGKRSKTKIGTNRSILAMLTVCMALFAGISGMSMMNRPVLATDPSGTFAYEPQVKRYAAKYGISEYLPWLMAIIDVESGGSVDDVMQSSESLGLDPNSLDTAASLDQGCQYFSQLLEKAETLGVDFDSVLQAYNYGSGYLDFVAEHGGVNTDELAQEFANIQANGEKTTYLNLVAVKANGGWRYSYGNMFYVTLVHNAKTELYGNA